MTQQTKNTIGEIAKTYLPFIGVFLMFFYIGVWSSNADSKMFDSAKQKQEVIARTKDKTIHMSLEKKQEMFVTRREYNFYVKRTSEDIKEIKELLKKNK